MLPVRRMCLNAMPRASNGMDYFSTDGNLARRPGKQRKRIDPTAANEQVVHKGKERIAHKARCDQRLSLDWRSRSEEDPPWIIEAIKSGRVLFHQCDGETWMGIRLEVRSGSESFLYAKRGDWIVRGVEGDIYPLRPNVFEAVYEAVN